MSEAVKTHLRAFLVTFFAIAPAVPLSWFSEKQQTKPSALQRAPCDVSGESPAPDTFEISSRREP